MVSPFSAAIVADAQLNGGLTEENLKAASYRIGALMGGVDPQATALSFVVVATSAAAPTSGNLKGLCARSRVADASDLRDERSDFN